MFEMKTALFSDWAILLGSDGAHYVEDLTSILEEKPSSLAAQYEIRLKIVGASSEPVASNANGDLISHGSDGYLSLPDGWVTCLPRLISDDNKKRELGASGRVRVEEHHSTMVRVSDLL